MFRVGQRFGEYHIVAQLRTGGMATLLLGERVGAAGFARRVAIKVVHPHLAADARFAQMLIDEALLASRIQHSNVVHVEQLGEVDGAHFLAMEYVHGGSLAELLRALADQHYRVAPQLAVWIAVAVADGLHAAHETRGDRGELLGVVHRDVSPQNVLLSFTGQVKVIDFGIAKAVGRGLQTDVGSLKGKLPYMAPEQAFGKPIDRRTDVYALGIVLWEMLTMQRLFPAEDPFELLETVRHPQIAPPSRFAPGLPPALDAVVMSALALDPDARPRTALEFRQRLADALPDALALESSHLAALMVSALECADAEAPHVPLASMVGSVVDTVDSPPPSRAPDADLAAALMAPRLGDATAAGAARVPERPATPSAPPAPADTARRPRGTSRWFQLGALAAAAIAGAAGARAMSRRTSAPTAPIAAVRPPPSPAQPAPRVVDAPSPPPPAASAPATAIAPRPLPPHAATVVAANPARPRAGTAHAHHARRHRATPQYVDGLPLVVAP